MNFEEQVRFRISKAPYGSREKNLLKVLLGEIQLNETKSKITDEFCYGLVRKMIKANEENLSYLSADDIRREAYEDENSILTSLLPTYLDADQIQEHLVAENLLDAIKAAKNDGQAVGVAMGHFKRNGLPVEGETVKQVVQEIRKAEI